MKPLIALNIVLLLIVACSPTSITPELLVSTPAAQATEELQMTPTLTVTPTPTGTSSPEPTATMAMATITPEPQPESTSTQTELPKGSTPGIVINADSIALFDQIPDEYIQAASQLSLLFRHASVGANIRQGLDCLANNYASRPNSCDRGLSSSDVIYDPKYDASNWTFKFHAPQPNPNPGWWNKVNFFIDDVDTEDPGEPSYQYISFILGYVDALENTNLDDVFFSDSNQEGLPNIHDLEALESRHPDQQLIYWTLALARAVGTPDSQSFNDQLRAYTAQNGKILMDIADIESHQPDGTPCYGPTGNNIPVICQDYTDEANAGHLNAVGRLRMAKAFWVMMAQLAGWRPDAGN